MLTVSPIVEHFQILSRREMESDGYLRVRAILTNEDQLAVSIYSRLAENTFYLIDYRFHWQDKNGNVIRRWDNARHHPELRTFPYHIHIGGEKIVKESEIMSLADILKILESAIKKD